MNIKVFLHTFCNFLSKRSRNNKPSITIHEDGSWEGNSTELLNAEGVQQQLDDAHYIFKNQK